MSDVPHGWASVAISVVADLVRGVTYKKADASASPVEGYLPILRATNINGNLSLESQMVFVPKSYIRPEQRLRVGDIVVATSSGSASVVGKSAALRGAWEGSFGAFCTVIRPSPQLAAGYLTHLVASAQVRKQWRTLAKGTSINNLKSSDLANTIAVLPPAAEQKRIVAAVEEQFSRLDAGVAALERARQNLKRMRAAVLQAAVSGRLVDQDLGEGTGTDLLASVAKQRGGKRPPLAASADIAVPDTWAVASLEAVTDPNRVICYGILIPRVREGGTVPYVEVKDLRASRLDVASLHRTSAKLHGEFSRSQLNSGDVVLAIRGSYDRALVVPAEVAGANVSRDVARIAPLPGIDASFVAAYLMSPPALQYLRQRARGVAVKGVNIADIRSMPIPLPPLEEQRRIVREADRINSIIEELESVLDAEQARATAIRSSVLAAAFSGKLVPQDPADEPASLLLERIAAERASSNGHRPARGRKPRVLQEEVTT